MLESKGILNTSLKIALIFASVAMVVNTSINVYSLLYPSPSDQNYPQETAGRPPELRPGMKAPTVPGVDFARSSRTLLLVLSTTCSHCVNSTPFYGELAAALSKRNSVDHSRIVAVFPQGKAEVARFRKQTKLSVETVAGMPLNKLGVSGTPTILLVSPRGIVLQAWVGSESKEVQDAISSAFLPDTDLGKS